MLSGKSNNGQLQYILLHVTTFLASEFLAPIRPASLDSSLDFSSIYHTGFKSYQLVKQSLILFYQIKSLIDILVNTPIPPSPRRITNENYISNDISFDSFKNIPEVAEYKHFNKEKSRWTALPIMVQLHSKHFRQLSEVN